MKQAPSSMISSPRTTCVTFLLVLFARILGVAEGFCGLAFPAFTTSRSSSSSLEFTCRSGRTWGLFAAAEASPLTPIPNEFSRPLNTDRILKTSSGKQRRSYRDYRTTLEASPEECSALADRFDLKSLESLKADLSLTLPPHYSSQSGGYLIVQVEGSIIASLTQTCVRTNEDFEVTVEFPVSAIVKPISAGSSQLQADDREDDAPQIQKKKKSKNTFRTDRLHNLSDMTELQQLINRQEDEIEFGVDDVLEDESIYSLSTGNIDVGELVAQTFWLNLDPYPKKPGSGPMEFSISG
jgi:hypothetical protein